MKTAPQPDSGLDPLLSIEDLAALLGGPVATIYDWRDDGIGPCLAFPDTFMAGVGIGIGLHLAFTLLLPARWTTRDLCRAPDCASTP